MEEIAAELLGEALPLVLRAVAAVVFTLVGAVAELNALSALTQGDLLMGLWTVYMGAVALYAGLFVFGSDVLERVGDAADAAA